MLYEVFSPQRIKLDLEAKTKIDVFEELVKTMASPDSVLDEQALVEAVELRESKMNTIIQPGVAVPHGYSSAVNGIIGAIGFSPAGIEYSIFKREHLPKSETALAKPVHLFFLLLMDESSRERHLRVLSRLLELLKSPAFFKIQGTESPEEVYNLLRRF